MSRENVEIVRAMTEAFLRGDVEQSLAAYDPDVEWDGRNLPDGTVARGVDAVVEHVLRWAEQWEDDVICFEPMTAPTDALVTGERLQLVEPGAAYQATFSVTVTDDP